jgi:hypothetical protein
MNTTSPQLELDGEFYNSMYEKIINMIIPACDHPDATSIDVKPVETQMALVACAAAVVAAFPVPFARDDVHALSLEIAEDFEEAYWHVRELGLFTYIDPAPRVDGADTI